MTSKQKIKLIDQLIKELQKDFGSWKCKEIAPDCASCNGEMLRGYLEWWKEIIEI